MYVSPQGHLEKFAEVIGQEPDSADQILHIKAAIWALVSSSLLVMLRLAHMRHSGTHYRQQQIIIFIANLVVNCS